MHKKNLLFALLAASLYSISIPFSKILLNGIDSTLLAGFLYFGAGIGMMIFFLANKKKINEEDLLTKKDFPYTILMVVLDIFAIIFLLYGLKTANASSVSLLNNFEIVTTSIIALVIFKEKISFRTWFGILLIVISSFVLSFDDIDSFSFSKGCIFVLLAVLCWGLENNCTRKISNKNTYEIVMIKGLCCGIGSLIIGFIINDKIQTPIYILFAIILGFISYGLSIFFYVLAQRSLGAAKTSAFYSINPFIGSILSVIIVGEKLKWSYFLAFGIMAIATLVIIVDTRKSITS